MLLDRNPENRSAISRIPIPAGERGEKFVPQPLARPLGLPHPPQPGQNSPVDRRTLSEKKADFSSYEKALERRRVLFRQFLRPYFQDWKRMDHYKGKSFVSNERLFKREKALWFPNMWGGTLRKEGDGVDGGRDMVYALRGKVSVVGIQSGIWAEEQVATFLGGKEGENPALKGIIESSGGLLQRVDVNVQSDWVRSLLVRLFKGRLRKSMPEEHWGRYFMVKLARDVGRGLTEDVRDAMGFLNSQVGYVYLLDTECRIRWAGSGHAWKGEVEWLNMGIKRLVEEAKERKRVEGRSKTLASVPKEPKSKERELEKDPERAIA
jgi:mitochondrial ATPase complex subunit ATP10